MQNYNNYNFFKFDLCPHKDKLVLRYIKDILIDLLSKNEISCHKNFEELKLMFLFLNFLEF